MSMTHITSTAHTLIKQRRKLQDKKGRASQGLFIAEGIRTCKTLLEASVGLEELFATSTLREEALQLVSEEQIIIVNDSVMKKLSSATTPSGILGTFRIPAPPENSALTGGIVLTHINDPGNMGTLIRTCAALAMPSVVCIEGVDPWSPKVVQASTGTIGTVALWNWSWDELITASKEAGIPLAALVVTGGSMISAQTPAPHRLFVVGNEATGIPNRYLEDCSEQITLPMPGNTESLNAAIAGSIALYLQYLATHKLFPQ